MIEDNRTGYIYIIKNSVTDKKYIGQTSKTIDERWREHLSDSKRKPNELYQAMREIRVQNFYVEQIEECPLSLIDEREIYWIAYFNSYKNGYNATPRRKGKNFRCGYSKLGFKNSKIVFDSIEEFGVLFESVFNVTLSSVTKKVKQAIKEGKDCWGLFPVVLDRFTDTSTKEECLVFIKSINYKGCCKEVKCIELDKTFMSVGKLADYLIENNYYLRGSKGAYQAVVSLISQSIKDNKVSQKLQNLHFEYTKRNFKKVSNQQNFFENKKVKCLQLNLIFNSQIEAAQFMIDNNYWTVSLKTARLRISDLVNLKLQEYHGYSFCNI